MTPQEQREAWLAALNDPAREAALAAGDGMLEFVRGLGDSPQGEPAFDPEAIRRSAEALRLPDVAFPHPFLERSVRVGLAHIDATFKGDHPRYGVGTYGQDIHDGFPPTIIWAIDALTLWGLIERAEALFGYWLAHFVRADGTIAYYGPSISEYGMLLTTARRLLRRGGSPQWLREHAATLGRLAAHLGEIVRPNGQIVLPRGVPEADERENPATYFHNAAWAARGLQDWAWVLQERLGTDGGAPLADAQTLQAILEEAVRACWPDDPDDWWLSPSVEAPTEGPLARPTERITGNNPGSYTNYRYWPELMSSGMLPQDLMRRIVKARLSSGGQFCGITRFVRQLDDWPLMEYLDGLWALGMHDDYRLGVWGHICYHQAAGHLTAYEQASLPPGERVADYCLPCQLTAARAARRLVR